MTTSISTADARKKFADIVNKVAYGKESIVLTRRGQEIAALVSIEELELWHILLHMSYNMTAVFDARWNNEGQSIISIS